jgi:hypothetical protein
MIPKPGKKSNGRFVIPTNQLTADSFKGTGKAYTKKESINI